MGVTTANAGTTAVTTNDATVLGQLFVNTQSTYFNSVYGGLSDSAFINATVYQHRRQRRDIEAALPIGTNLLQAAETAGQSVQAARAGLVGQFVHDLVDYNINDRGSGLTAAQWLAAEQRQETIDNKIAVSLDYQMPRSKRAAAFLSPIRWGCCLVAATAILQSVTYDPATVTAAILGINAAVAHRICF